MKFAVITTKFNKTFLGQYICTVRFITCHNKRYTFNLYTIFNKQITGKAGEAHTIPCKKFVIFIGISQATEIIVGQRVPIERQHLGKIYYTLCGIFPRRLPGAPVIAKESCQIVAIVLMAVLTETETTTAEQKQRKRE